MDRETGLSPIVGVQETVVCVGAGTTTTVNYNRNWLRWSTRL
ncbi:hypothetical protein [Archaeoglobus sp. UBA230]|nr:hypothetical protein [Archaeoglobus sp. UBA230]